jgi:hypothetical protein
MSQENVELVRLTLEAYQHPEMVRLLASDELDLQMQNHRSNGTPRAWRR